MVCTTLDLSAVGALGIVGATALRHPDVGAARCSVDGLLFHPVGELHRNQNGSCDCDLILGDVRSVLVVGAGGFVDDHFDDCVPLVCRDVDGDLNFDSDLAGDRIVG